MGSHRGARPRYGRIAVAGTSLTVTVVAVLGGVGVLGPAAPSTAAPQAEVAAYSPPRTSDEEGTTPEALPASSRRVVSRAEPVVPGGEAYEAAARARTLPSRSGTGRRVVFSESAQRVWLVDESGTVMDSWLVSGSLTDNLQPGTYEVWSRSEQAWGIDDSGTMKYFVRFAHGERAAIGFHDIPVDDGRLLQTVDQLGTPQSHGCIRQRRADAVRMWDFAQMGTTVVVTA